MAGHVHFDAETPNELLKELLGDIKALRPEASWIDLHLRSAGDDGTHYIHLCCKLKDGERLTQRQAVFKIIQLLKNELGTVQGRTGENPKFVRGWSISTVTAIAQQ